MNKTHYTYSVTWSEHDKEHVGLCTEFPSLSFLAKDPADALNGIQSTVQEVIQDIERTNEP